MEIRIRSFCAVVALMGLLAFAQYPRALNICLGADGALRTGLGCFCPACTTPDDEAPAADGCGCGDSACQQQRTAAAPAVAVITTPACCAGHSIANTHASLLPQVTRTDAPQAFCCAALASHGSTVALINRTCMPRANGQPPGRCGPYLIRTTVLRS